jgi:hypothetical protein
MYLNLMQLIRMIILSDLITATTSTSSFDRSQLETILSVMKSLKGEEMHADLARCS